MSLAFMLKVVSSNDCRGIRILPISFYYINQPLPSLPQISLNLGHHRSWSCHHRSFFSPYPLPSYQLRCYQSYLHIHLQLDPWKYFFSNNSFCNPWFIAFFFKSINIQRKINLCFKAIFGYWVIGFLKTFFPVIFEIVLDTASCFWWMDIFLMIREKWTCCRSKSKDKCVIHVKIWVFLCQNCQEITHFGDS